MALYLGNQKVSLRSGQDPTFDYGFDSNGRLVFANKNATEINNFLNYDSSYSEILDLSNLSKMEKVAVNGTADRKMEGLKGLLVSPNAPFTGSGPQINASYTGLNKSALVSLFESVPYNVGYTKVGNPTIMDGVASGFSDSDCLIIEDSFANESDIDIILKITTSDDIAVAQYPISWSCKVETKTKNNGLYINNGKYGCLLNSTNNTLYQFTASSAYKLSPQYIYYLRLIFKASDKSLKMGSSTNGVDYTYGIEKTLDSNLCPFNIPNSLKIGRAQPANYFFKGSIDLNNTYIKVNVVPWFTGKPAMTKTCSIVGATGTAYLTQEDKNIILNKGWSLTVQ